jgi:predicted phosphodiesterase
MNAPVAIISDIHGNLPALQAVIADIEQQGIQERVCLGDIVGYGAQPSECIELLRAKNFHTVIQGNHDAYVAADEDPPNVSDETVEVIRWTRNMLTAEQRTWLGALPLTWQAEDYEVVHASLHRPDEWGYVLEPGAAALHFIQQQKEVCFIGHSHQPKMFVEGTDKALDITCLESIRTGRKQVVNVGSVGQPRDKDERACYVVYRRNEADVWWRRMRYDIAAAQQAIVDAGLPGKYAHRLSLGK